MDRIDNLTELADERLAEYAAEVLAAIEALAELDAPTEEQITEAEELADHLDAVEAERTRRAEAAAALAERTAALRSRFTRQPGDPVEQEPQTPAEQPPDVAPQAPQTQPSRQAQTPPAEEPQPVTPVASKAAGVAELARRVERPAAPAASRVPITITAAADVPEFATGSHLSMEAVGTAVINRMRGFGTPSGDGKTESLQHFGVAMFRTEYPKELTIDRHSDDMEVLTYAGSESRLPGNSLVAAGGWCAPSETLYDLCAGETAEGILSIPEVNVSRGGIKYTSGPSFADIYTNTGFCQTEAQAIAGTAKTCYEVPCPPFVEVRLDACGVCIKAPILTNAAYPELVQRWVSGAMLVHQHKINAKVLTSMATAAGAAKVYAGIGTTAGDTLGGLELIGDVMRGKYRLSHSASLEVVVPYWVKGAVRSDLALRSGQNSSEVVTDSAIAAHFAARNLSVQFVYDWQPLADAAIAYPATFQALVYPAGTFIKGTADVINLNAVYDAASLAANLYTALFFEQGVLVAKMCYEAALVTLPICNAGQTGANALDCTP